MPAVGRLRYLDVPPKGSERPRGTLVLIHAFPLNARMWEPQSVLADAGWRIIAPQLRGMDGVDDPPAAGIDEYAADVIDLLDALQIEEAVVGGLSMGGYVTFALLRLAQRYVRGIVLADTRPQGDSAAGVQARTQLLTRLREKGTSAIADQLVPTLLSEETLRDRPEVADRVRGLILSNSEAAIATATRALMSRTDATPLLSTIRCPTLILVGEHDELTPPSVSRAMQEAIPGSELAIIPRAGHLSNIEQPEVFNAALARFLSHRI